MTYVFIGRFQPINKIPNESNQKAENNSGSAVATSPFIPCVTSKAVQPARGRNTTDILALRYAPNSKRAAKTKYHPNILAFVNCNIHPSC